MAEFGESRRDAEAIIRSKWETVVDGNINTELRPLAGLYINRTIEAYQEEGRHYHTLTHIDSCLVRLANYHDRPDYRQLFLAVLWHDVVYDTHSQKNEENSARIAGEMMRNLSIGSSEDVERLIQATKAHKAFEEDEQLICAIDLSILAEDWPTYESYAQAIRQEYSWVPEGHYAHSRYKILDSLAAGDGPFEHPDFMYLNATAKENMKREQRQLGLG